MNQGTHFYASFKATYQEQIHHNINSDDYSICLKIDEENISNLIHLF